MHCKIYLFIEKYFCAIRTVFRALKKFICALHVWAAVERRRTHKREQSLNGKKKYPWLMFDVEKEDETIVATIWCECCAKRADVARHTMASVSKISNTESFVSGMSNVKRTNVERHYRTEPHKRALLFLMLNCFWWISTHDCKFTIYFFGQWKGLRKIKLFCSISAIVFNIMNSNSDIVSFGRHFTTFFQFCSHFIDKSAVFSACATALCAGHIKNP